MIRALVMISVLAAAGVASRASAQSDPAATDPPIEASATVEAQAEAEAGPVEPELTVGADAAHRAPDLVAEAEPPAPSSELAQQLQARADIVAVHRAFGIATWASMAVTAVLGWIQFADEYGFHGSPNETACGNGTAVMQELCEGVPWPHAIAGFTTAALYFTTAGLSLAMPAPLEASADLELHKTLRWIHLATMLATAVFGVVTANIDADFGTRQALAIVHQGLGVTTFGLLTAAAAVIVF